MPFMCTRRDLLSWKSLQRSSYLGYLCSWWEQVPGKERSPTCHRDQVPCGFLTYEYTAHNRWNPEFWISFWKSLISLTNQIYTSGDLNYIKLCGLVQAATWQTEITALSKGVKNNFTFLQPFSQPLYAEALLQEVATFPIDPIGVWILKPNSDLLKFIWWYGRLKMVL